MANYVKLIDRVKEAEVLAEGNGGKLPRPTTLKMINPQLMQAIFRNPSAFAHIPKEHAGHRTPEQWVALAEEIAANNGGFLPTHKDLSAENRGLASYIYRNAAKFDHIPRAAWTKAKGERIATYVEQAEKLAQENGGQLNLSREFQAAHNALTCAIRSNPEAFAHIPRSRRVTKSLSDHVAFAKQLAESNGGFLPPVSELKRDYPALRTMMQNYPEAFAGLSSASLTTTIEEYVALAKKLAEENGGVLPAGSWLHRDSYRNLESAIYRKPKAFAGIEQEVLDAKGVRIRTRIL